MYEAATKLLYFGVDPLSTEDILALADGTAVAALAPDPAYRNRLTTSIKILETWTRSGARVYGTNTGVGDSCETQLDAKEAAALPLALLRFHGCGTGRLLDPQEAAAVVACRLASLSRGYSAVRPEVLERLCTLLNRRILPCIPAEGSVGASGDLTPLSYVASLLVGEREAYRNGEVVDASRALAAIELAPLALQPKESLAIMNGTSVMTGLGCLAWRRAKRLARLSSLLTAMACDVLHGEKAHFHPRIFELKPHPGTCQSAQWIRAALHDAAKPSAPRRLQDRYSLRCAPHVIGVLLDCVHLIRPFVEVELNSVNDNPILDPETEAVYHGGNFYGGHICFAMDSLKNAVANIADLLDRQMALLCNPVTNNGLPANLVAARGDDARAHHGFKAMSISISALTAEALKLTMPASVFSRSTENHNQDKVSMGTIAARDCLRVLELVETSAAIHLLAVCQAADIRSLTTCSSATRLVHASVRECVPMNTADRRMDGDIGRILQLMRAHRLPIDKATEL